MIELKWSEIAARCEEIAEHYKRRKIEAVFGVPMGGLIPAMLVAKQLKCRILLPDETVESLVSLEEKHRILVIDDLVDSGRTMEPYLKAGLRTDALYRKGHSPLESAPNATLVDSWLKFPWEKGTGAEDAVVRLLEFIGEDPLREGLIDTPRRVVKALGEMTGGLRENPVTCLGTMFTDSNNEMVTVRGIRFTSMCEHHLLPFSGTAVVAYMPQGKVVGLSKIPRLVEVFARRPQLQERLTRQIAETLHRSVFSAGTACVMKAHHSCMGCRGVRQPDAEMVTSSFHGCLSEDPAVKSQLLSML